MKYRLIARESFDTEAGFIVAGCTYEADEVSAAGCFVRLRGHDAFLPRRRFEWEAVRDYPTEAEILRLQRESRLPNRVARALAWEGCRSSEDIEKYCQDHSARQMLLIPNFGKASLRALAGAGFGVQPDHDRWVRHGSPLAMLHNLPD